MTTEYTSADQRTLQEQLSNHGGKAVSLLDALVPVRAWMQDKQLHSWAMGLLVVLTVVPCSALILAGHNWRVGAWIFATYFAVAWLLLLWVIVRPKNISWGPVALVVGVGYLASLPIRSIEDLLNSKGDTGNPFITTFTIGIPEELSKLVPVIAVAVVALLLLHAKAETWLKRETWLKLQPRDYLFLGAISGSIFGAAEAYLYLTAGLIPQLGAAILQGSLPGVMNVVLSDGTWRFLTDPISHALWAGIAGYFIGLAIQQYRRGMVKQAAIALGCTGFVMAAILHGINDWDTVTGHFGWILLTLASVLLFLGYARAGTSAEAVSAATEAITSKDFDGPHLRGDAVGWP